MVSFKARTLIFKNETIQAKMDISKSNLPPSVFTLNYYLSLIANLILSFVLDEELQTSRKKKEIFPSPMVWKFQIDRLEKIFQTSIKRPLN